MRRIVSFLLLLAFFLTIPVTDAFGAQTSSLPESTYPTFVIKAVEREPLAWNTPEGWKIMRPEDHSVVEDCLWGQTSYNEKYGFSMPKSFDAVQGAEICRSADELKQVRAK